ncbi:hypothetical protein GobsU_32934 [Candidatus Vecturithrix granuli]|uniref:PcRGLX/YetA-like N-terminal RIFT barrel domain-containing protein n=1 Tax=Vecturithrix granuli TaxID=1499967 RepID=A0A081C4B2_VECG1|nr:hypothetical protein GobsU_32934 [Candidatus Vecturithrix granuli]
MLSFPLLIVETAGIPRKNEPVTVGIPFPKALFTSLDELSVVNDQHAHVPAQLQVLDRWHDQSLKWVLFDFQVTLAAHTQTQYTIRKHDKTGESLQSTSSEGIIVREHSDTIDINTDVACFIVDKNVFKPLKQVLFKDHDPIINPAESFMDFVDEAGQHCEHIIRRVSLETVGPLRTTLKVEGQLSSSPLEFFARIHFYAQSALTKIDYTIRNPQAAQHLGGLWDLGDAGSVYFQDLSLQLALLANEGVSIHWTTCPERPLQKQTAETLTIYQDSSGGINWNSSNHVNRFGKVMHSFRGYQVRSNGELIEEGSRTHPIIAIQDSVKRITGTVKGFWENFPKALEGTGNLLKIRVFPNQYQDLFELQGGEQKTHTLFLSFEPSSEGISRLAWIENPLIPHLSPEHYSQSKVVDYLTPSADAPYPEVQELIYSAIEGDNTFVDRRELIDEYGWRNFGDLYADHEKIYYQGEGIPISHYNNQYDCIYGMIIQYLCSGNIRWFPLFNDLTHHVIDIDIYHTTQDKPNFNGGFFWHTDHYTDAATATHRGYSKATIEIKSLSSYGGGPANEHNYTTGLVYHYYLTGEIASKETAIGLADWIINMDDGTQTKFRFMNTRNTGLVSTTDSPDYSYHGPGRGAGYSINALIDAFLLTKNKKYLTKAEQLIQRCIHPEDNIEERELTNTEVRWSYTIFLQILGRYLDLKAEINELDYLYCYAKKSLLHYAQWMRDHEVCTSTVFDTVEYPTETWPAHDLRKSNVFKFAAKYSEAPLRKKFLQKSEFFFEKPLQDLFSFETRTLTRPLIILMTNTTMHSYFQQHPEEKAPNTQCSYGFGKPQQFKPQLYYMYKLRTIISHCASTIQKILKK